MIMQHLDIVLITHKAEYSIFTMTVNDSGSTLDLLKND